MAFRWSATSMSSGRANEDFLEGLVSPWQCVISHLPFLIGDC